MRHCSLYVLTSGRRGLMSDEQQGQPERSGFGRGWIPVERDIGLPGEAAAYPPVAPVQAGAEISFPHRGDVGVEGRGRMSPCLRRGDGEMGGEGASALAPAQFSPVRQV